MKLARVLGLVAALFISMSAMAQQAPPKAAAPKPKWKLVQPQTPAGVTLHSKLVCAKYGEREVTLDLYVPDAPGKHPAVVLIHGGGWAKGSIEHDKPLAERLAVKGYVCALVDYRMSGEAKYPAALHDCKAAVRFLRANAAKYKVNTDRIGVMGGSAGGHLAGLTAMTSGKSEFDGNGGNANFSSAVQACIVMAATQDLYAVNREKSNPMVVAFLGATAQEKPDLYREISPINHVRSGVPPTIFVEGERDTLKVGRAEMQEKLKALGIETSLHVLKDGPHPFWMSQPWLDQTAEIAIEFFGRTLQGK